MRFVIVDHAVDRYIERVDPSMPYAQVRAHIEQCAHSAVLLKEKTASGEDQWLASDPPCILVTRKGIYREDRGAYIVVTVFAEGTEQMAAVEARHAMLLPEALRLLVEKTSGELRASLERLYMVSGPLDCAPARALLLGFEILMRDENVSENIRHMHDILAPHLDGDPAEIALPDTIALWQSVIDLARSYAKDNPIWWQTTNVWEIGLGKIKRFERGKKVA